MERKVPIPPQFLYEFNNSYLSCLEVENAVKPDDIWDFEETITFSKFALLNIENTFLQSNGIIELLCSLESAIRQVPSALGKFINDLKFHEDATSLTPKIIKEVTEKVENTILNMLMTTNCAYYIISAVREKIITIPYWRQGSFILAIESIDGLENLITTLPMATTFGIYWTDGNEENYKDLIDTCGEKSLIAAGYVIYGPSMVMTISFQMKEEVLEFLYDKTIGEFVLLNRDWKIPNEGTAFFLNKCCSKYWLNPNLLNFTQRCASDITNLGSFTANFHAMLKTGGMVADPPTEENPNGQFQLLCKLNPLAMICKKAGGVSYGGKNLDSELLLKTSNSMYETIPCIMGSKKLMNFWAHCNLIKED